MNALKKIFACLGAIFSLALFAAACGISAVWAVRWFDRYNVVPPVESGVRLPALTSDERQPSAPAPAPAPEKAPTLAPVSGPAPAPSKDTDSESAPPRLPAVCGWSMERVLERSHTGRELKRYAADYVKVMNASIAELDKALAANDKRLNAAEARKLRAEYVKRRDTMDEHTREFLTRIVVEASAKEPDFEDVTLIEEKNFTRLAAGADITTRIVETIDRFHMQLPPLPKPLKLPEPPARNKAQPRRGK